MKRMVLLSYLIMNGLCVAMVLDHCHEETLQYGVRTVCWQGPGESTCSPVDFFPHDDAGRERYSAFLEKFPHYAHDPLAYINYSGFLHFYAVCKVLEKKEQGFIDASDDKMGALEELRRRGQNPATRSRRALRKVKDEIPNELYARMYIQTHPYSLEALRGSGLSATLRAQFLESSQDTGSAQKAIPTSDNS